MNNILEGKGLIKKFKGLVAVKNVNFILKEGEILSLIGPNGAGKTTLFNLIAGVYSPDEGEIRYKGREISRLKPHQICHLGIARTFQIPKPFLSLSVLENVSTAVFFGSKQRINTKKAREKAIEVLDFVALSKSSQKLSKKLILSERKRLELARALATNPQVLLLDEVVAGLNETETFQLVETILKIRDLGVNILMIEHVMRAVMKISDRIIVLNYGEKIAEGKPFEIANNTKVIKAYLGKGKQ